MVGMVADEDLQGDPAAAGDTWLAPAGVGPEMGTGRPNRETVPEAAVLPAQGGRAAGTGAQFPQAAEHGLTGPPAVGVGVGTPARRRLRR